MCGIIGYIGSRNVKDVLLQGLLRMEYRGYDSAGIAVVDEHGLTVCKSLGIVSNLAEKAQPMSDPKSGAAGIGHTRWATHGVPSDKNAHPHCDTARKVAVVHNGIIENSTEIRKKLETKGVVFESETDTECLAHMIGLNIGAGMSLLESVTTCLGDVVGTLGIAVVSDAAPGEIVAARRGSPLVVGISDHGISVASDVAALAGVAERVVFLQDDEIAFIKSGSYEVVSVADSRKLACREEEIDWKVYDTSTGDHEHFMIKEIMEQPESLRRAVAGRALRGLEDSVLGGFRFSKREIMALSFVRVIGCGSAMYAGMYGASVIERLSGVASHAEPSGEFVTRDPEIRSDTLYIFVSQSGETADTLAAIRYVKERGGMTFSIVNVVGSAIARESDGVYLHAGPEVSVASTKAFTSMQTCLLLVAVKIASLRDRTSGLSALIDEIVSLPETSEDAISMAYTEEASAFLAKHSSVYYVGHGLLLPVAYEGAQKMKEVSYVHAEAYSSSELKHGPLALISANFPSVTLVPPGPVAPRVLTAAQQIKARSGPLVCVSPVSMSQYLMESGTCDIPIHAPDASEIVFPILATIPLQILAYETSLMLGRDIDRPRNLAKSVTVA